MRFVPADVDFNPLPPHGGRRILAAYLYMDKEFQSTPSAWRETSFSFSSRFCFFISIHSLRMEGDACVSKIGTQAHISIHSLRMEGDDIPDAEGTRQNHFNPLPPHGGRPDATSFCKPLHHFNPLPPHGGRLSARTIERYVTSHFNPLPPHGGRHATCDQDIRYAKFQSTPSAWRETQVTDDWLSRNTISIHSLRMEGDPDAARSVASSTPNFNPLPPHGGRLVTICREFQEFFISIHSLRMEGDLIVFVFFSGIVISIHSLRMEGDTRKNSYSRSHQLFQSTPSAWRETEQW